MTVDAGLTDACGPTPSWFCEAAWNLSHHRLVARGADWFITKPLLAVVVLLVTVLVNRWLRRAVTKVVTKVVQGDRMAVTALQRIGIAASSAMVDPRAERRSDTLGAVARAVVSALVWTLGVLTVLGVFKLDLAPLIAGAGIAGVAVGFGAQSLVKDCIAGFFIILEDQFGVGDEVDLGLASGTVEAVTLRSTTVRSVDGTVWAVPNGSIVRVGNQSKVWSAAVLDVTVWHDASVDTATSVIGAVASEVCERPEFRDVVQSSPTVLGVERLAADGVTLRVSARVTPGAQARLLRAWRAELKPALDAAGVSLHPRPAAT